LWGCWLGAHTRRALAKSIMRIAGGSAKKPLSLQPAMWYPALQTFRMRLSVIHAQN